MHGVVSRLVSALAYPRAPEDFLALAAPLESAHEVRARVVDVVRETHDVATLVLAPSSRLRPHRAGQHVALTASLDGVRRTRVFSVASAEQEHPRALRLTVKARPGGAVTPRLVQGELRGAVVALSQPTGDFVLPRRVPARLLLVSGGSGITPVMSMLRTLLARGHQGEVTFVHHARSEADVIFRDELARVAREASPSTRVHVRTGPLRAGDLGALVDDLPGCEAWACGPEALLDVVAADLAAHGASDRLHTERFTLGPAVDAGVESEVTFARSGRRARGAGTLLSLAEGADVTAPSGCRMGLCGSCVCRKRAGTTRDLRTGELTHDADVDVKLCVSAPVGPVILEL